MFWIHAWKEREGENGNFFPIGFSAIGKRKSRRTTEVEVSSARFRWLTSGEFRRFVSQKHAVRRPQRERRADWSSYWEERACTGRVFPGEFSETDFAGTDRLFRGPEAACTRLRDWGLWDRGSRDRSAHAVCWTPARRPCVGRDQLKSLNRTAVTADDNVLRRLLIILTITLERPVPRVHGETRRHFSPFVWPFLFGRRERKRALAANHSKVMTLAFVCFFFFFETQFTNGPCRTPNVTTVHELRVSGREIHLKSDKCRYETPPDDLKNALLSGI